MVEDWEIDWHPCKEPTNSLAHIVNDHTEWVSYYFSVMSGQVFRRTDEFAELPLWEVGLCHKLPPSSASQPSSDSPNSTPSAG